MTLKVLIIDERSDHVDPFNDLQARGFIVQNTSTGKNLMNSVRNLRPDVIIIDSYEPEKKNGRIYRSIRDISQAPILVLSVIDQPGIVEKVLDHGADEYLVKPVSTNLLAARVNALARRSYT